MTEIPFGVRPTIERAASPKGKNITGFIIRAIYAGSSIYQAFTLRKNEDICSP